MTYFCCTLQIGLGMLQAPFLQVDHDGSHHGRNQTTFHP